MINIANKQFKGMRNFIIIWYGQLISIFGTSMTKFAVMIWAFQKEESALTLALLGFFSILPYVLLSPLAGAIVDKMNRKHIMIISDLASGIVTILLFVLFLTGKVEIWHLFVVEALYGTFEAFQIPAYSSSVTLLVPKNKLDRASGMRSLSTNLSRILAPVLAGVLLVIIDIEGILILDIITFLIAVTTLIVITIPKHKKNNKSEEKTTLLEDIQFGLRYLFKRKGLLYLLFIFTFINFIATITYFGILPAMILARTNNDEVLLGSIQAAIGIGGLVGSIIVSTIGCPKNKVATILFGCLGSFLLGDIFLAIKGPTFVWFIAGFLSAFFLPFIMASENILWQSKVEPEYQGRIFSIKGMLQLGLMPLGYLLGGVLADYVFEPLMANDTSFLSIFSVYVGEGYGSGMGLMFLVNGILGTILCIIAYLIKDIRNIEIDLPDYDEKLLQT